MRILYIHGWGSKFDPSNEKLQILSQLGELVGFDLDYTAGFTSVITSCLSQATNLNPDVIVGTSLGGYVASHLGALLGIPFVSINPAIDPSTTLKKYLGSGYDYSGEAFTLNEDAIKNLPKFNLNGFGIVLLDENDEILSSQETIDFIQNRYPVTMFSGGHHRYAHMQESLELIEMLVQNANTSYGLDSQ